MISRITSQVVLSGITAPATSQKFLVEDKRHLVLELYLVGATSVVKVKVSNAQDIDFASASTISNPWYYVDLVGLGDGGTTVTGSTGISTTTATTQKGYAINVDMARWVAIEAATLSAGSLSAVLSQATNE